ncbi:MAG: DNA polymerase III subunit gamma/tau, partial [Planctomycetota bacterium]
MAGYLVLARKYRPKSFADVLGQEVVTGVLQGALQEGRIGQAYLFSGPRGTGKTTTARILARCLNCVEGPTAEPCGKCTHCLGIDAGNDPDLIEIDAATHTGVDHIRELREQATYAPMKARYKVYIVDEVHMLSKPAFNALLKTLEEPPPHVVFLFATTELHKILPTILSRCQVLKLNALSEKAIGDRLREVLQLEGVTPGPGVVEEVARGARGGMRDALSLMDKLLALAGSDPTLDDLRRLGGHAGAREIEELLTRIEAGDKGGVLDALSSFDGAESELITALLGHLRKSLLAAFCGEDSPLLPSDADEREPVLARAKKLTGERVELWMQELLHARERMRSFPGQERLVLELTLLDLARPETTMPLAELESRLAALEAGEPAPAPAAPPAPARPAPAA